MNRVPLAERMRPKKLSEVLGQEKIIGEGKILTEIVKKKEPVNLIFWGPPGTGKTTLARILANEFKADFVEISAVTAKKKDVEEAAAILNKSTKTIQNQKSIIYQKMNLRDRLELVDAAKLLGVII